jgi:hypothetical protein
LPLKTALYAKESMQLISPHIPLGITLDQGLEILKSVRSDIEYSEEESFYKVTTDAFSCGFYEKDKMVSSSWFDDPLGRDSDNGLNLKVTLYLERYGEIPDWEDGINNGWIQFFTNAKSGVGLAYGIHKDVIRFNQISI